MNHNHFEEIALDGTRRTLDVRTYSTWPTTTTISKQRTSMGKTFSVGITGLSEDGGATNITDSLNAMERLVRALKSP